jgi:hypothetical protein
MLDITFVIRGLTLVFGSMLDILFFIYGLALDLGR